MSATELSGCVIVNGMPGAGKSTVATQVARLLRRAARVKGDVNEMILSGRVGFAGQPAEEDMRRGFGDVGWWFDTSALTAIETAERIVREAAGYPLLSVGRAAGP